MQTETYMPFLKETFLCFVLKRMKIAQTEQPFRRFIMQHNKEICKSSLKKTFRPKFNIYVFELHLKFPSITYITHKQINSMMNMVKTHSCGKAIFN